MKKVINRKVYNTETGIEIGTYNNGVASNDFNYVSETLFKTKKGRYFLYGEGGANTGYAKYVSGFSYGSEDISPFSKNEAMDWLENRGLAEEFEDEFASELEEA